jgi:hypothetical protein
MKFPPYPAFMDKTPVDITITNGISDDGSPNVIAEYSGKCFFDGSAKKVRNSDGSFMTLAGKIYIGCDIAPSVSFLEGHVEIFSKSFKIYKGSKLSNPDGTVHHSELELV